MAKVVKQSSPFEQSFMFHMIRDFFLLLVLVASVEMGIRYALVRYDFASKEQARVDQAAQQLANDVKSIMLNSGGPLAAQTVYPILNRNYDDLGLSIAVVPSEVTVESMRQSFKIDIKGLQPNWKVGQHLESAVNLTAEQFCLNCHVKAKVGDVLGTVKVGSYLERKEAAWWTEVRLTAGALSLKILVHTILLFFLLKVRMAPLLSLRSTVSQLARGLMDLSPRAKVNGADEFGELAQDLNHFLDRINVVVTDLDQILNKVVDASGRLGGLNRNLEQTVDGLRETFYRNADAPLEGQAAKYHALAQTLREMALLEAKMENIAHSGQQVLQRLTHADKPT
jgi:methyl-accepting chemotaxis protein